MRHNTTRCVRQQNPRLGEIVSLPCTHFVLVEKNLRCCPAPRWQPEALDCQIYSKQTVYFVHLPWESPPRGAVLTASCNSVSECKAAIFITKLKTFQTGLPVHKFATLPNFRSRRREISPEAIGMTKINNIWKFSEDGLPVSGLYRSDEWRLWFILWPHEKGETFAEPPPGIANPIKTRCGNGKETGSGFYGTFRPWNMNFGF